MNEKISVIIVLHNNEAEIESHIHALRAALQKGNWDCELILIDNGSSDGTFAKVTQLARLHTNIHGIKMRTTFGESSALEAGFQLSDGAVIVFYTARVRPNPEQIPGLVDLVGTDSDMVVGWRSPRRDSRLNRFISRVFNYIITRLARLRLHDINSGILVTRRQVLEQLQIYGEMNQFIPVLAQKQGYRVTEGKIEQLKGSFRHSWFLNEYIQRSLDILTVLFLTRYSKKPIHFLGFVGALFFVIGAAIDLYLFFYRLLGYGPIAGRPLLLLGALLLVIGVQMIAMGLIGEMINFTHAAEIKEYNIEKIYTRKPVVKDETDRSNSVL